ncbi:MAG: Gfo/Idh/MocA family protein, partial [Frankia sp.]
RRDHGPFAPPEAMIPRSVGQRRRDHGPFAPPEAMIPRSVGQRRRDHGPFAPPEAMIPRSVEDLSIGWIGAGAFSSAVLYPAMRTAGFTRFTAVASAGGLSARRFGERAGFEKVLPDGAAVATAPGLDVVVIATPHDSHAALTVAALTAGRDVWCEKPVALSLPELDAVAGAVADSGRVLSVGLNRRFSPAARIAREHLDTRSAPITLIYRVAAGSIAAGHWYADRRQGGRLLGEVCHFIDTCCYLSPSPVVDVAARAGRAGRRESLLCDDVTVILTHADGSTSVIIYSSARPRGVRKERIEALAGDVHLVLDDFREVLVGGSPVWRGAQDKGHDAAVAAFRDRILDPHPGSATDDRLVSSRLVLLAAGQLGQLGQSLRKPDRDPEATLNYGE